MKPILSLLLTFTILFSLHAGEPGVKNAESATETASRSSGSGFLSHLSVGLRASTLGFGVQAATPVNKYLNLRAGLDVLNTTSSDVFIGLDDPHGEFNRAFGYVPEYKMKGTLDFFNGNILLDFHPTKGIFHLTGGVFIGSNKFNARGFLVDASGNQVKLLPGEERWPSLDFDSHELMLNNGRLDADVKLGGAIKPYFGMGLGRAIAKNNRLSFKFELGMIYQGDYELVQNGNKVTLNENNTESFDKIESYTRLLKWWPMMNFQLSYRLY